MGTLINLSGNRYGMLTVLPEYIRRAVGKQTGIFWKCRCDCGNEKFISASHLKNGKIKSCGCLRSVAHTHRKGRIKPLNKYDLTTFTYGVGFCDDGTKFYFDLEDYDKIKDYRWVRQNDYIVSINSVSVNNKVATYMHQLIMPAPDGLFTSHVHGKPSANDNRKANLRICNKSMVLWNMAIRPNNTSGVTGVSYSTTSKTWVAQITHNKIIEKKSFKNKDDAIRQRKEWEEKFFGAYSRDNSQAVKLDLF